MKYVKVISISIMILSLRTFSAFAADSKFDYVYILNSPSTVSAGNDSIVSFDKLGNQSTFVAPDPNLNGIREIAFGLEGKILYAVQSHSVLGIHRIIYFDNTGTIIDELNVPITGNLKSMTVNIDGLIYVSDTFKVYQINPNTKDVVVFASYSIETAADDMDHDSNGNLYITTANGGNSILKVDTSGNVTTFADSTDELDSPFGITFDHVTNMIWVVNFRGSPASIYKFDLNGNGNYFANNPGAEIRGILIDSDGLPLVPLGVEDKVVKVDSSGNSTDIWMQNLDFPVDLDFGPVPASVITIDIKPSKKTENVISLKKGKNIKVAIVGDETFDALQVNPATIKFGANKASPVRFKSRDYNHDGFSDLILTFKLNETGIACGDVSATLTGQTFPDPVITFAGSDSFTVEPCP